MFKSINEINRFDFADCVLAGISNAEDGLVFSVEALIVKADNSQNTNYTDSYAGSTEIKLNNASIKEILKSGYKYYDANGKLLKEVSDEPVLKPEWGSLIKTFEGNYLPDISLEGNMYTVEVEMIDEDGTQGNSYLLKVEAEGVTVTWEKYMNRVQR